MQTKVKSRKFIYAKKQEPGIATWSWKTYFNLLKTVDQKNKTFFFFFAKSASFFSFASTKRNQEIYDHKLVIPLSIKTM